MPEPEVLEAPGKEVVSAESVAASPAPAPIDARYLKSLENGLQATKRVNQRLEQEIETLKQSQQALMTRLSVPESAPTAPTGDALDQLVQTDWKGAVRKLAEEEAQKALTVKEQERVQQEARARYQHNQSTASSQVLERYPDLNREDYQETEVGQAWAQVTQAHPEYLSNEFGPILVMQEMEKQFPAVAKAVAHDPKRIRASATGLPRSSPAAPAKVALTREQKDFCTRYGIKEEEYQAQLRMGGV